MLLTRYMQKSYLMDASLTYDIDVGNASFVSGKKIIINMKLGESLQIISTTNAPLSYECDTSTSELEIIICILLSFHSILALALPEILLAHL